MSYEELEQAVIVWANARADIRAVIEIGSRARREHLADEWSDLDLLLLTTDATPYSDEGWSWALQEVGEVLVAYVEEANAGDTDVQAIFGDGTRGDFTFVTVEEHGRSLDALLEELPYQEVLSRGARVLYDRQGSGDSVPHRVAAQPLPLVPRTSPTAPTPTEQEYRRLVNGFWLYAVRVAKFIRRGDLWRAMLNLVFRLNLRLLTLMEWQGRARGRDTWYDGRFMEEWADSEAVTALASTFARYDAADLQRALSESVELFRRLAQQIAGEFGYEYPSEIDRRVIQLIRETWIGEG